MRTEDGLPAVQTQDLSRAFGELRSVAGGFSADIAAATREMREMDAESRRLSRSLGTSLHSAFERAVLDGARFGDVMRGLAGDVAGRALDAALRPVANAVGAGVTGLAGSLGGAVAGFLGFAKGGAFGGGRVRPFASGGVVSGPTMFPMRGGAGLMGEAGPEAIMPLARGADGRLGVRAEGRGRGVAGVTVNIATPDVAGFRRSRAQVAAQVARAMGRAGAKL